jgi:hypothetical protein
MSRPGSSQFPNTGNKKTQADRKVTRAGTGKRRPQGTPNNRCSVLLKQFRIFTKGGQLVGVAVWALIDDLVAKRIDAGDKRLSAVEWKSGGHKRIVDVLAPFGGEAKMWGRLIANRMMSAPDPHRIDLAGRLYFERLSQVGNWSFVRTRNPLLIVLTKRKPRSASTWGNVFLFILSIVLPLAVTPGAAIAFSLLVKIENQIPSEKYETIRLKIPFLQDVPIEIIRFFEVKDGLTVLRLDNPRYCINRRCLTFVANGSLSSYVAIQAPGTVWLIPQPYKIGIDAPDSDSGSIIVFETISSEPSERRINVFVSSKVVVVTEEGGGR